MSNIDLVKFLSELPVEQLGELEKLLIRERLKRDQKYIEEFKRERRRVRGKLQDKLLQEEYKWTGTVW